MKKFLKWIWTELYGIVSIISLVIGIYIYHKYHFEGLFLICTSYVLLLKQQLESLYRKFLKEKEFVRVFINKDISNWKSLIKVIDEKSKEKENTDK